MGWEWIGIGKPKPSQNTVVAAVRTEPQELLPAPSVRVVGFG